MKISSVYLGIDVSKTTLHLATPDTFVKTFSNTARGHQELIVAVRKFDPAGIVLEASGGYERMAVETLQDAGLPVTVAQPGCVRHFAKSVKVLAKTDKIDARVIARFAAATQPDPTPPTPENVRKLRALNDRREQVIEDRVRECNRLEACADPHIARRIEVSIEQLRLTETELDEEITRLLEEDEPLRRKAELLQNHKGVGPQTTRVLLAHFPELGSLSRQQAAALAGLAPHPRESGNWRGRRRIYGGRAAARKALYMAARTAARWCPVLSEFYNRLRAAGKPYNVAIIACARKLIIRLNTVLKEHDKQQNHATNETAVS